MAMEKKTRRSNSSRTRATRRKIRRRQRTVALLAVLAGVVILGFLGLYISNSQSGLHVTGENSYDVKAGYRSLEVGEKEYAYKRRISTVLVTLVDSEEPIQEGAQYGCDMTEASIHLIVMDGTAKKLRVLGIPGELVAVSSAEVTGDDLLEAVRSLLGDVPVDQYIIANRAGISWLNEYLGGITVDVPNNDLAMLYMDLYEGSTATLTGDAAADFVLFRGEESASNRDGFAARQESFLDSALPRLREKVQGDPVAAAKELDMPENAFCSSIGKSQYLGYLKLFLEMSQEEDYYTALENSIVTVEDGAEFHVDEEKLQQLILDLFYEEG